MSGLGFPTGGAKCSPTRNHVLLCLLLRDSDTRRISRLSFHSLGVDHYLVQQRWEEGKLWENVILAPYSDPLAVGHVLFFCALHAPFLRAHTEGFSDYIGETLKATHDLKLSLVIVLGQLHHNHSPELSSTSDGSRDNSSSPSFRIV